MASKEFKATSGFANWETSQNVITAAITSNSATTVDTVALNSFYSIRYDISIVQGSKTRSSKVTVQTDGTSVDSTEYGIVATGGAISGVAITATASAGNMLLQVTVTDAATTIARVRAVKNLLGVIQPYLPGAPTIGTATVATGQSYTGNANTSVSFTAPADNGNSAITSYTVTSSSGNSVSGASSPLTVSELVGIARTYTVTANNSIGSSVASSASNSVTPSSVPQAPTIGTVTIAGSSASVPFTENSNGGSSITSYTATASSGGFSGSGSASPITVSGLSAGTSYTFTVTATNANGNSIPSSASNSVTPVAYSLISLYDSSATGSQNTTVNTIAVDSGGNIISGGTYKNAAGRQNAYIAKHNTAGTLLWQRYIISGNSSYHNDSVKRIKLDSSGNIYALGNFASQYNGQSQLTFIRKYNSSGALQWSKMYKDWFGPANGRGNQLDLAIDSSGNFYSVAAAGDKTSTGNYVAALVKYDSAGNISWQRALTSTITAFAWGYGVALDSTGNIYVAGSFPQRTSTGGNYANATFIAKYNSAGTLQWTRQLTTSDSQSFSTSYTQTQASIVIDSSDNIFICGSYYNQNNFMNLIQVIAKYNTSGTMQWNKVYSDSRYTLSGGSNVRPSYITLDSSNNIYITGSYYTSAQATVGNIMKLDSSGSLQWQRSFDYSSQINQAIIDSSGSLYLGGSFRNTSNGLNGLIAKLPSDGSATGTYTIESGRVLTYGSGSLVDKTSNNLLTESAPPASFVAGDTGLATFTDSNWGSLTDSAGSLTSSYITI